MSRKLKENEKMLITALLDVANVKNYNLDNITVDVINDYTGTIRSSKLNINDRTKAASECNFYDVDGIYVDVVMFLDKMGDFGELYIWKVDDAPLVKLPENLDKVRQIRRISESGTDQV